MKMGAIEHARYELRCPQCRTVGLAEWWETDGPSHLRNPSWGLEISNNFEWVPGPELEGQGGGFYGRPLICVVCKVGAEHIEIDGSQLYAIKCPPMRPVAGSHYGKPSIFDQIDAKYGR